MTRSRSAKLTLSRWGLLLLLAVGSGWAARAQAPAAPVPAEVPASNWPWVLGVLVGGIALGVLGARMWARKPDPAGPAAEPEAAPAPEAVPKKPAENVVRAAPVVQSLRQVQSSPAASGQTPKQPTKHSEKSKRPKPNFNSRSTSSADQPSSWPPIAHRPSAMNLPPTEPGADAQPLETGDTIEWSAPTSTAPAIQELIDSTASAVTPESPVAAAAPEAAGAPPVAGPVHYYAPAPDVPSIEHRKLSPQPLPQMPVLITLPQAEAMTAQFCFSPQADQSRIIGNGVRELKEFFQFELPPTEQFTTITNLAPGKLEKRDDAWHVVHKATIALS